MVDDPEGARGVVPRDDDRRPPAAVLVKVDVGFHRCGVDPLRADIVGSLHRIARLPGLEFRGLLSHAGHSYLAKSAAEIEAIARHEAAFLGGSCRPSAPGAARRAEITVRIDADGAVHRPTARRHGNASRQLRLRRSHAGRPGRRATRRLRALDRGDGRQPTVADPGDLRRGQ